MKRPGLLFAIALFIQTNASAQFGEPCLPEGIVFNTQEQIDSFQTNHPDCTEIEGNVTIAGDDITNLNGLSEVTSIGGDFEIGAYDGNNPNLLSLMGLENLATIGGDFSLFNNTALTSLIALESLVSIDGSFTINEEIDAHRYINEE